MPRRQRTDRSRILYHSVVVDIFRPFLTTNVTLKTFEPRNSKPDDIFWTSIYQLRHMIVTHPLVHRSAMYAIFWHMALLHVANASLQEPNKSEAQFYFLLCIIGYHKLSSSFPIMASVVRGLLTVATKKGIMTPATARGIQERFRQSSGTVYPKAMLGAFVLDLDLALEHPHAAHTELLARYFDRNISLRP